eukprot:6943966-Prymnesium_polylepis.1
MNCMVGSHGPALHARRGVERAEPPARATGTRGHDKGRTKHWRSTRLHNPVHAHTRLDAASQPGARAHAAPFRTRFRTVKRSTR